MKVLHIQKLDGFAGSENYLSKILPQLKQKGIDVDFLAITKGIDNDSNKQLFDILKSASINIHQISFEGKNDFSIAKSIKKFIENADYQIVHSHLVHGIFWTSLAKLLPSSKRWKYISTWHGYDEGYQAKYGFDPSHKKIDKFWFVSRFGELFTDRTVTISDGLKKLLIGLGVANAKKTQTIHYGFNFPDVVYSSNSMPYAKSSNQLLIIGRLLPVKGHEYAFKALAKIKDKVNNLSLVLVGNGDYEDSLRKMASDLQIENLVHFEGFKKNIHDYLNHSKVVLIPSVAEGFGVVALEAMHNKKPIICFDVPALNEIVLDSTTGVVVEPFDVDKYAQAISELITNEAACLSLGEAAKKRLDEQFSIQSMVNKTIDLYNEVI